jgi:hypothetical protein
LLISSLQIEQELIRVLHELRLEGSPCVDPSAASTRKQQQQQDGSDGPDDGVLPQEGSVLVVEFLSEILGRLERQGKMLEQCKAWSKLLTHSSVADLLQVLCPNQQSRTSSITSLNLFV